VAVIGEGVPIRWRLAANKASFAVFTVSGDNQAINANDFSEPD
jgi:hypothetical protein